MAISILGNVRVISLDLFHQMALFRAALEGGSLPTEDIFSYMPTVSPSVHHEWAVGAVAYLVTVTLGLGSHGLVLLRLALLGVVAVGCFVVARRRGASGVELAITAPLAIVLFWPGLSPVRAHLFTFAALAVLLYLLETDREGRRWWLLVWPVLLVAWLNLHGGFVVGAGLLGLYTLERFLREWRRSDWREAANATWHLAAATAATVPLMLVNPYGLDYIPYLWDALLLDRPHIPEWSPLWAPGFRGAPLMLFSVTVVVLAYTLVRGRRYWTEQPGILLVLAAALAALDSVRILPIYMVVWMCYVPAALSTTPLGPLLRSMWGKHAKAIAAVALLIGGLGLWNAGVTPAFSLVLPTQGEGYRQHFPAGAADYLREVEFRGNLMTPFGVGAYVSWQLHPAVMVGMDSRYEVAYPPELVDEAIRAYDGEGDWEAFLDRHPTDAVLAPAGRPLDVLLTAGAETPGARWFEVYRDDAYAIFAANQLVPNLPRVDRRGQPIPGTFP